MDWVYVCVGFSLGVASIWLLERFGWRDLDGYARWLDEQISKKDDDVKGDDNEDEYGKM